MLEHLLEAAAAGCQQQQEFPVCGSLFTCERQPLVCVAVRSLCGSHRQAAAQLHTGPRRAEPLGRESRSQQGERVRGWGSQAFSGWLFKTNISDHIESRSER